MDGGDGKNTTKVRKAYIIAITKVIYRRWIHFLASLNREKLCSVAGLFFNELEPCGNIALDIGQGYSFYHLTCQILSSVIQLAQLPHQIDEKYTFTCLKNELKLKFYLKYVNSNIKSSFTSHFTISFQIWDLELWSGFLPQTSSANFRRSGGLFSTLLGPGRS